MEDFNIIVNENDNTYTDQEIKTKLFTPFFTDQILERNYLTCRLSKEKNLFYFYSSIIILSHFGLIAFSIFFIYDKFLFILLGFFLFLTLILLFGHMKIKSVFLKSFLKITIYLTVSFSLILCLFFLLDKNKYSQKTISNFIILIITTKNFSFLIWSQNNCILWVILFFMNITVITISSILIKNILYEGIIMEILMLTVLSFV